MRPMSGESVVSLLRPQLRVVTCTERNTLQEGEEEEGGEGEGEEEEGGGEEIQWDKKMGNPLRPLLGWDGCEPILGQVQFLAL